MKLQWNHMGGRYGRQLPGQALQALAVVVIGVEDFRACFISDNDNRSYGIRRKTVWLLVYVSPDSFNHSRSLCVQAYSCQLAAPTELSLATQSPVLATAHSAFISIVLSAVYLVTSPTCMFTFFFSSFLVFVCMCQKLVSVSWSVLISGQVTFVICSWKSIQREQRWDLKNPECISRTYRLVVNYQDTAESYSRYWTCKGSWYSYCWETLSLKVFSDVTVHLINTGPGTLCFLDSEVQLMQTSSVGLKLQHWWQQIQAPAVSYTKKGRQVTNR